MFTPSALESLYAGQITLWSNSVDKTKTFVSQTNLATAVSRLPSSKDNWNDIVPPGPPPHSLFEILRNRLIQELIKDEKHHFE